MVVISNEVVQFISDFSKELDKKVVIVPHVNPDGDAIGSAMAMYHYFNKFLTVNVVTPSTYPSFLSWLPDVEVIVDYTSAPKKVECLIEKTDLILILDHNAPDRSGDLESFIEQSKAIKMMVDHHPYPSYEVDYSVSSVDVSSTSELVCQLLKMVDSSVMNLDMATSAYTGIMTDTGNFVHNLHSETFNVVSDLLELGIDQSFIYDRVFNNFSFDRMRLMGYTLYTKTILLKDIGVAIMSLDAKELRDFNFEKGDTEGFVNLPLASKEVKASVLILEKEDGVSFSFRSKGDISINKIASTYYSGGGHKNAAGGIDKSGISIEESVDKLSKILHEEKELFQ